MGVPGHRIVTGESSHGHHESMGESGSGGNRQGESLCMWTIDDGVYEGPKETGGSEGHRETGRNSKGRPLTVLFSSEIDLVTQNFVRSSR